MGRDDGPESQRPFLQPSTLPHREVVHGTGGLGGQAGLRTLMGPSWDPQDI